MKTLIASLIFILSTASFSMESTLTALGIIDETNRLSADTVKIIGTATEGTLYNGCKEWDFHHGKRFKQVTQVVGVRNHKVVIQNFFGKCKVKISQIQISFDVTNIDGFNYPLGPSEPSVVLDVADFDSDHNFLCDSEDFRERTYVTCFKKINGELNRQNINLDGVEKIIRIQSSNMTSN